MRLALHLHELGGRQKKGKIQESKCEYKISLGILLNRVRFVMISVLEHHNAVTNLVSRYAFEKVTCSVQGSGSARYTWVT